ncbi:hypothetical protein C3L33_20484, partial [Rhododendron williamsianum]
MRLEFITWFFTITTLAIFCFITIPVHSHCLENQKSLLLQLKNGLQFNPNSSVKLVNWALTNDCCQWNGVTCDHFDHVIGLNLNTESISGALNHSSSLFGLKFIEKLNLAYNSFNSTQIPSNFGILTNLRYLNFSHTDFVGQIPNSLANLSQLVYLDFSSNNFTSPVPSFQRSKNLTYIDLSHNALTGPVPSIFFEGLSNLVFIDLEYNSFNGSIPSSLFSCPSLQTIWINNNQFSGYLPNCSLSSLVSLHLSSNKLQGPIPSYLFAIQSLRDLSLSFNNFSGTIQLESIHRLQNLSWLELSHNSLSVNATISESSSSSFPQFRRLGLASCKLQKFPPLMNQSLLHDLDLSDNQISGVIPNWIWNIGGRGGGMGILNLSCNVLSLVLGDLGVPLISMHLRSEDCNKLRIVRNVLGLGLDLNMETISGGLNDSSSLFGLNFLEKLNLAYNCFNFPQIPSRDLSLSFNNFSGTIQLESIHRLQNLTLLDLSHNSLSVDASISNSSLSSFPQLRRLGLASCKLQKFPPLMNQSLLHDLDLSDNQISGVIPNWIWNIGGGGGDQYTTNSFPLHFTSTTSINEVLEVECKGKLFQVRVMEEQMMINTILRTECSCTGCKIEEEKIADKEKHEQMAETDMERVPDTCEGIVTDGANHEQLNVDMGMVEKFEYAEVDAIVSAGGLICIWNSNFFKLDSSCCNRNFILLKEWGKTLQYDHGSKEQMGFTVDFGFIGLKGIAFSTTSSQGQKGLRILASEVQKD